MGDITRRDFLKSAGLGATALATGSILAPGVSSAAGLRRGPAQELPEGRPRRGGTLNVGFIGGSSSDTLNPLSPVANVDYARVNNLFDPLVRMTRTGEPVLSLAEHIEPNRNATVWTIRVRQGVTFHNGRELTADDVIYTFRETVNPKSPGEAASSLSLLDAAGIRKRDRYTVSLPFKQPYGTLVQVLSTEITPYVMPVGFDKKKPVGTGPFKLKSFTPGVQSTFVRNKDYWKDGLPYADTLVMTDYEDEVAQANALVSGPANLISGLSTDVIPELSSAGKKVVISDGGGWNPFTMRVDVAPFNDVRVRQAMRYIVDRPQMRDLVFKGHGALGNDVFGIWAPEYNHHLPQRHQDIDRAKHLLKAAGHEHLTVQLETADIAQGVEKMAQVFAQQATAAGVKVNISTTTNFYGPQYLKWIFAQDYWDYNYYLPQVADATLVGAPFNECHFDNPRYTRLYKEAVATLDGTRRTEIAHEMQLIDYETGGYIIPFFVPVIDAADPSIGGLVASRSGVSFNTWDFKSQWVR